MIRPPPRWSLLPYATHFRSGVVLRPAGSVALLRLADERVVRASEGERVEGWLVARIGAEGVQVSRGDRVLQDRKSTRLNSSHAYILYAGFCLKEKTQA